MPKCTQEEKRCPEQETKTGVFYTMGGTLVMTTRWLKKLNVKKKKKKTLQKITERASWVFDLILK